MAEKEHLAWRIACALLLAFAAYLPRSRAEEPAPPPDREKIVHVLNRLGFGPRPGDVEAVSRIGLDAYVRRQLHPESIDDSTVDKALASFDTLKMDSGDLMTAYYAEIRHFIEKQKASGNGAELKARYGIDPGKTSGAAAATPPPAAQAKPDLHKAALEIPTRVSLRALGELQTAKILRAVESQRQLEEVLVDFWSNHFNIDAKKGPDRVLKVVDDRETIRPHVFGKFRDLLGASAQSPAMMVYLDNAENSAPRKVGVIEQWIRAKYVQHLTGVDAMPAEMQAKMEGGLNENYGREILELHSLGVDGGYTQQDVQEVGRCFTGWGYNRLTGKFRFNAKQHDEGAKKVLGQVIPANGGEADGEKVLDLIAASPATADHIALKLCERLVADEPPPALVKRAAAVFRQTGGDLREVVATIVTSPEFNSPASFGAKIKSPFEFAVSAVRAAGGHVVEPGLWNAGKIRETLEGAATIGYGVEFVSGFKRQSLNWSIHEMGEPLFAFQAPTGYPEDSRKWVSAGALIARLNFALALTGGKVADASIDTSKLVGGVDIDKPAQVLDCVLASLLQGGATPQTRDVLMKKVIQGRQEGQSATVNVPQLVALVLGSPEFQRR